MRAYKNDFLTYTANGAVKSDCADITFVNNGSSDIILNNSYLLASGQFIAFSANNDEIDLTIYTFYFSGIGNNSLNVIRKVYI